MSKHIFMIIVFILFSVFSISCSDNPVDFNDCFTKIQDFDLANKFNDITYFGPERPGEPLMIEYTDGTSAVISGRIFRTIEVRKNGSDPKIDYDRIKADVDNLTGFYKEMHMKCISRKLKDSTITVWLDSEYITKESLPFYQHPGGYKGGLKTIELIYTINNRFESTDFYKTNKPVKIDERWFYLNF